MALKGVGGGRFSFDSQKLIDELKMDIYEFGKGEMLAVWLKKYPQYGVEFIVNYDFVIEDDPTGAYETEENERIVLMSAERVLDYLQKQNEPIELYEVWEET